MRRALLLLLLLLNGCLFALDRDAEEDMKPRAPLEASVTRDVHCTANTELLIVTNDAHLLAEEVSAELVSATGERTGLMVVGVEAGSVRVQLLSGAATGVYGVSVRRNDEAEVVVGQAVELEEAPRITAVSNPGACEGAGPQTMLIAGERLQGAKAVVTLPAEALSLVTSVNAAGTQVTVQVPEGLPRGGPYALRLVRDHSACPDVAVAEGLSIVAPPALSEVTYGPVLSDGAAPRDVAVTVRLAGEALVAQAEVYVGEVKAERVSVHGGSAGPGSAGAGSVIDAQFAPGALLAGEAQSVT